MNQEDERDASETRERCPVCDAPLASQADRVNWLTVDLPNLCWSRYPTVAALEMRPDNHAAPAVDWRSRSLNAEVERDEQRKRADRLLAELDGVVSRSEGTCLPLCAERAGVGPCTRCPNRKDGGS